MRNILILIFLMFSFMGRAQTDSISRHPEVGSGDIFPDLEGGDMPIEPHNRDEVFTAVQEMPEFIGGEDSMMRFIFRNLIYPKAAIENNVEGRVRVKFTVTTSGEIINPKVISKEKLGYGCEEAAIAVIQKMPKWKPGRQNNNPVAVYYNIPFTFRLK